MLDRILISNPLKMGSFNLKCLHLNSPDGFLVGLLTNRWDLGVKILLGSLCTNMT